MQFQLQFSEQAMLKFKELEKNVSRKSVFKQLKKALGFMETNLRYPSLRTHKFDGISCKLGEVFESYVQNNTPGAYRIFWTYGPGKKELYILDISSHL